MVTWSNPAKNDLKNIYDFIARDSKHYAKKVSQEFIEKSKSLIEFPGMGRIVPEIEDPNIRELIIYSYRLVYELSHNKTVVLSIIHAKQNFSKVFDK